jgi:hypothetical protein
MLVFLRHRKYPRGNQPFRNMTSDAVQPGDSISHYRVLEQIGKPRMLLEREYGISGFPLTGTAYDVSADGQRFLMVKDVDQASAALRSMSCSTGSRN